MVCLSMLPKNVRTRIQINYDIDGKEISRDTVPATHAWKIIDLETKEERFVSSDDQLTDPVLACCIFGQGEGDYKVSIEKLGIDGKTRWGPKEFGR